MKHKLALHKQNINYTIKVSNRAKRLRVAVYCDGSCVVTAPHRLPQNVIESFLIKKSQWLLDKISYFSSTNIGSSKVNDHAEFLKYKEMAFTIAQDRLNYFNEFYGYKWNKITIKNQKTRWGSCSRKGNLNFNYKIALLPTKFADYIIVHELCHLGQFNHSQKFWNLVSRAVPDYLDIRNELKSQNYKLSKAVGN